MLRLLLTIFVMIDMIIQYLAFGTIDPALRGPKVFRARSKSCSALCPNFTEVQLEGYSVD